MELSSEADALELQNNPVFKQVDASNLSIERLGITVDMCELRGIRRRRA